MDLLSGRGRERKSHDGALRTTDPADRSVCGPARPGIRPDRPDPWPVVGAHINLAADTDRIGARLTLDNVVSDAGHALATHRSRNPADW